MSCSAKMSMKSFIASGPGFMETKQKLSPKLSSKPQLPSKPHPVLTYGMPMVVQGGYLHPIGNLLFIQMAGLSVINFQN